MSPDGRQFPQAVGASVEVSLGRIVVRLDDGTELDFDRAELLTAAGLDRPLFGDAGRLRAA